MEGMPDGYLLPTTPPHVNRDREDDEALDQTPPPDHDDWLVLARLGRRYTRMRWEQRRRMKIEREFARASAAEAPNGLSAPPRMSELDHHPDEGYPEDQPPPDHEGWIEACANGMRASRERWEKRRRSNLSAPAES